MSDPNIYQGSGKGGTQVARVNVVAAHGVDNTGAADTGSLQLGAWNALGRTGQAAWYDLKVRVTACAPDEAQESWPQFEPMPTLPGQAIGFKSKVRAYLAGRKGK